MDKNKKNNNNNNNNNSQNTIFSNDGYNNNQNIPGYFVKKSMGVLDKNGYKYDASCHSSNNIIEEKKTHIIQFEEEEIHMILFSLYETLNSSPEIGICLDLINRITKKLKINQSPQLKQISTNRRLMIENDPSQPSYECNNKKNQDWIYSKYFRMLIYGSRLSSIYDIIFKFFQYSMLLKISEDETDYIIYGPSKYQIILYQSRPYFVKLQQETISKAKTLNSEENIDNETVAVENQLLNKETFAKEEFESQQYIDTKQSFVEKENFQLNKPQYQQHSPKDLKFFNKSNHSSRSLDALNTINKDNQLERPSSKELANFGKSENLQLQKKKEDIITTPKNKTDQSTPVPDVEFILKQPQQLNQGTNVPNVEVDQNQSQKYHQATSANDNDEKNVQMVPNMDNINSFDGS